MAGCSVPLLPSLIHNPRNLLQCTLALLSSVLDCETAATSLKTHYSANSQGNSQTSSEGRARENDPEPDAALRVALRVALCVPLCVPLCVRLCVELNVAFPVALPVPLFVVPTLVSVAAAGVPVAEILAMTDAGHVGPAP